MITSSSFGNYSKNIIKEFNSKNISIGDFIEVKRVKNKISGILLPQSEFGDVNTIILKQKNGYNVGIKFEPKTKIVKVGEGIKLENFPVASIKQKPKLPEISLIATGGTIASRIDYLTGGVYMASKPEEVFASLPELLDEVSFKTINPLFQLASEDMGYIQWQKIATEIKKELDGGSRGIVIMHGTDMMGYSSAALSFMLENLTAPVVFTGGQRSSDRGSFDGALNLISSARLAANSNIAEVMVCMHETSNDTTCLALPGTKVKKMHTSRRDAFKVINGFPYARTYKSGKIEELDVKDVHRRSEGNVKLLSGYEPKVGLLKIYPNSNPEIIDWYVDRGYKGLIIEGTGLGHVPAFTPDGEEHRSWLPAIERSLESGLYVGMTSQCVYGRTHPYVYRGLRKLSKVGVEYLGDMISETALIKLGWAIGNFSFDNVSNIMNTNIAGELSDRTLLGGN